MYNVSMKLENALIVPGFSEGDDARYRMVGESFRRAGIKPHFVSIKWPRTVLTQNASEFDRTYLKYDPASTVVFGFSAGAMLALMAVAGRSPAALMLASMPAWFAEDLASRLPSHKRAVGKRRMADYETIHFDDLAKRLASKTYLFVAEGEIKQWPTFLSRAADANAKIPGSELIRIKRSGHNIGDQDYMEAINNVIARLASA
jgi:pimeloyl-ACP methyl ester carboxylesterase